MTHFGLKHRLNASLKVSTRHDKQLQVKKVKGNKSLLDSRGSVMTTDNVLCVFLKIQRVYKKNKTKKKSLLAPIRAAVLQFAFPKIWARW